MKKQGRIERAAQRTEVREMYAKQDDAVASFCELIFDNGKLTHERDCSDFMPQIRQEMAGSKTQPDQTDSRKRIEEWVEQTFNLDYRL